jgi:hypothetical protein
MTPHQRAEQIVRAHDLQFLSRDNRISAIAREITEYAAEVTTERDRLRFALQNIIANSDRLQGCAPGMSVSCFEELDTAIEAAREELKR